MPSTPSGTFVLSLHFRAILTSSRKTSLLFSSPKPAQILLLPALLAQPLCFLVLIHVVILSISVCIFITSSVLLFDLNSLKTGRDYTSICSIAMQATAVRDDM
jgi:hypothetical protein